MSATDWLMALGTLMIAAIVIKGFWRFEKTDAIDQPDNWQNGGGGESSGHGSGGSH
jgi:hypothetical protein